jgi:amidohydrolase
MASLAYFAAGAFLACTLAAATPDAEITRRAEALRAKLVEQRRDFHRHPELSARETRTAKVIADRLAALGLESIRTGVGGHGVVALLKGGLPGPVVAVRADIDALPIEETNDVPYKSVNPGVKHACGHDVHMTVQLGVAELLSGMKAQLPGTVKFIFQPAEEGAPKGELAGALQMVQQGALENPRPAAIYGLHATPLLRAGQLGWVSGPMLASADRFTVKIKGRKAHGAWPHLAIDPIVISAEAVQALQTIRSRRIDPIEPMVLTIGSIHGGNRENIIADEVTMVGTVRTFNEDVRSRIESLMHEVLAGVVKAHGAAYELDYERQYPVTKNPPEIAGVARPILERVAGRSNVIETKPVSGAEDFSEFQKVIPGFFYWLGVANPERGIKAMLHTADFDADEDSLVLGVRAMTALVWDHLERGR